MSPKAKVNKVATIAVVKANPLEKLATRAAAEINGAISPAMVAVTVSTIVASVVLTAVVSMIEESCSITLGMSSLSYMQYISGN